MLTKRFEMQCNWRTSHTILKEPQKQASLCGSMEGLEAAVEESVVVAGKQLMAENLFQNDRCKKFLKTFNNTVIAVNRYQAPCKCQQLLTQLISQMSVLFFHNCTWITMSFCNELTLFPAVPGDAISTPALPSGEAVTFVELLLFITAKELPVMYKHTVFMV